MNYQDLAGELNRKVSALHWAWRDAPIWKRGQNSEEPSIVHLTYSALLAVIGDAEVEWVALELNEHADRDATTFKLTVWTDDLALQAVREAGTPRPTVSVEPRTSLRRMELLKAPMLTTSNFGYNDGSVELSLTYPSFSTVLVDERGGSLLAALPRFVADLKA